MTLWNLTVGAIHCAFTYEAHSALVETIQAEAPKAAQAAFKALAFAAVPLTARYLASYEMNEEWLAAETACCFAAALAHYLPERPPYDTR